MKPFSRKMVFGVLAAAFSCALRAGAAQPVSLTVQSEPVGAAVMLDGQRLAVKTPLRLTVPPGTHEIRISKAGFKESARSIEIHAGAGFVSFQLEPQLAPAPRPAAAPVPATFKPRNAAPPAMPRDRPAPSLGPRRRAAPSPAPPVTFSYRDTPERQQKENWNLLPLNNRFPPSSAPGPENKTAAADAPAPAPETADDDGGVFPLVVRGQDPRVTELAAAEAQGDSETAPGAPAAPPAAAVSPAAAPRHPTTPPPAAPPAPECAAGDSAAAGELADGSSVPEPEIEWPASAEDQMYVAAADLPRFPEKFNILLLGLDRRDRRGILATGAPIPEDVLKRKPANSDVIAVVQLDFLAREVRVVNIPRDTKVRIPGHGTRKINAAYAFGRQKLARRVVESFLNIPIHRTVVVDWKGAKECIALFKGLGLDYNGFTEQELFWHLRKRSFARGDFHRIERQQSFMRYAAGEFLRMYNEARKSQGTIAAVKKSLLDMALKQGIASVDTDLTYEEAQLLAYAFHDYNVRDMTLAQVAGKGGLEGGTEEEGGVYFFNAYSHHSFDEIVARAQAARNP